MLRRVAIVVCALALSLLGSAQTRAAPDQTNLVEKARITVDDLKKDKEFGNAAKILRRAKGVLIVPSLLKGGFFLGGEGGEGVLLARTGEGWSEPAFYTLGSASFGLQIGLEQAEFVMLIMNDKAMKAVLQDEVKLGAEAGLAIVTLGSSAGAATTSALGADAVVWASSSGAYAGLTLNGSVLKPRNSWNDAFYGKPVRVEAILKNGVRNPAADRLRENLASIR